MSRVLLVTGGGRGIGAAVCRLGAARGYAVAVNYRQDREAAEGLVRRIRDEGGTAVPIQADVAEEREVIRLFDEATAALGPVTHLVNNAGITGPAGVLADVSVDTLQSVIGLNVVGTMLCAREAVRRMARSRGGNGGVIVNISSGSTLLGTPNLWVWYAASKGAVETFTLGLGREVASEGIRVMAVAPGFTATDILSAVADRMEAINASIPMGRPATPEEIAESVLFLLSDAAAYATASVLRVTGGR